MHAARAHLGSCCPWDLHQPHGFLVRKRFSQYYWRLLDSRPAYARYQKFAATSTTAVGSDSGLRLGWLVGLSGNSRLIVLTASQRVHHIDLADDHPQDWIQS